jgi:hypothetical protein
MLISSAFIKFSATTKTVWVALGWRADAPLGRPLGQSKPRDGNQAAPGREGSDGPAAPIPHVEATRAVTFLTPYPAAVRVAPSGRGFSFAKHEIRIARPRPAVLSSAPFCR